MEFLTNCKRADASNGWVRPDSASYRSRSGKVYFGFKYNSILKTASVLSRVNNYIQLTHEICIQFKQLNEHRKEKVAKTLELDAMKLSI